MRGTRGKEIGSNRREIEEESVPKEMGVEVRERIVKQVRNTNKEVQNKSKEVIWGMERMNTRKEEKTSESVEASRE
jgi:hypothetical protein